MHMSHNTEPIRTDPAFYDTAIEAGRQALAEGLISFEHEPRPYIDYQTFLRIFRLKGHGTDSAASVWRKFRDVEEFIMEAGGPQLRSFSEEELYDVVKIPDEETQTVRNRIRADIADMKEFAHEVLIVNNLPAVLTLHEADTKRYGTIKRLQAVTADIIEIHGSEPPAGQPVP